MNDLELIRQAAGVAVTLLLLAAAAWWLRRRGAGRFTLPGRPARRLEAVERLALGPQHALHLVRIGKRGILLGVSPAGCTLLETAAWEQFESREAQP